MALQMNEEMECDPCEVLGLSLDAPEKDIIVAYRKASLKCHPDRCPGDPEAAEKFSRICRAKDILLDPKKRAGFLAAKQRAELESVRAKARQQRDAPSLKVMYHRTVGENAKSSSVEYDSPNTREAEAAAAALHGKQRTFCDVRKVVEESPARSAAASAPTPQKSFFEIRTSTVPSAGKEIDPGAAQEEKERERRAIERLENAKRLVEERERKKVEEAQERQRKYQENVEAAKKEIERRDNEKREKEAAEKERKERVKREREEKKEKNRLEKQKLESEKRERQQQEKELKEREKEEKAQKQKDRIEKLRVDTDKKAQENNTAEMQQDEAMEVAGSSRDCDMQTGMALDENNEDPSCSRPLKRKAPFACSISYQPVKQPCKRGSLVDQLQDALESTEYEVPGITMSCRQMLAAAAKEVIPPSPDQHHFAVQMVEMVRETLVGISNVLDERAATATQGQEVAAEVDQKRFVEINASLEEAKVAYDSKKSDVAQRVELQNKDRDTLADIRVAEKTASARVNELAAKEKAWADSQAEASKAQQTFNSLVENGTPSKAVDAKKMLKEVETFMKIMKVEETLVWRVQQAVIPALQRKPDDRQGMDDMAITGMEGCFGTYMEEKDEDLNSCREQLVAARERVRRLRAEIDAKRQKSDEDAELLRIAKDDVRACHALVKEAEQALQDHENKVAKAAAEVQGHVQAAANFGRLLQSFLEIAKLESTSR